MPPNRLPVMLFLVALLKTGYASGAVLGFDDRVEIDFSSAGGKYIGLVGTLLCTANLVGEAHILTASHCIEKGAKPTFYFQHGSGKAIHTAKVTRTARPAHLPDNSNTDWVIAEIDRELGTEFGFLPVSSQKFRPEFETNIAGYSIDRFKGDYPTIHRRCRVVAIEEDGLYQHNCDTAYGASGAALLTYLDGKYQIVGVHIMNKKLVQNFAVSSAVFYETLRDAREQYRKERTELNDRNPGHADLQSDALAEKISEAVVRQTILILRETYRTELSETEISEIAKKIIKQLKGSETFTALQKHHRIVGDAAFWKAFSPERIRPLLEEALKNEEQEGLRTRLRQEQDQ